MIDIHTHILHAVDDGPTDFETSVQMITEMVQMGIHTVVATPHYWYPHYLNERVDEHYRQLKAYAESHAINIRILLANEIHLDDFTYNAILKQEAHTIGEKCLLIELPDSGFYNSHDVMLYQLQLKGYKIVLAHVERYKDIMRDKALIQQLKERNILFQMNATYITSLKTRRKALKLLKNGTFDIVASDCHGIVRRPNLLAKANQIVTKKLGTEIANAVFNDNANQIINYK